MIYSDAIKELNDTFVLHRLADWAVEEAVQAKTNYYRCGFDEDNGYCKAMVRVATKCLGCYRDDIKRLVDNEAHKRVGY